MKVLGWITLAILLSICGCASATVDTAGVVAAATPEAASAGARILAAGGNAVDAAVAVGFALAVTEPAMSGLGGQVQIVMFRPAMNEDGGLVLNGTSFAPRVMPADVSAEELVSHRATTVPTTIKVLDYAFRNHGSGNVSWEEVLSPAIAYAEEGFAIGRFRHQVWMRHREDLESSSSARGLFLEQDGSAPPRGAIWRQPRLAGTLRRIASAGGEDFYRGELARAIAADMEANKGWLTLDDLAGLPDPREEKPLRGSYRGHDVWTLPDPGGGWVVLHMLRVLEAYSPEDVSTSVLARAIRSGHRARRDHPTSTDAPHGETTHFSIVDKAGLAVSATASINAYFGARAAHPELGFLYNDYMHELVLDQPEHAFALSSRAMPYSSMSPTILTRRGKPVLVLGSPGSARIISAVTQVIHHWVDSGMPVAQAVAMHRIHSFANGKLYVEGPSLSEHVLGELVEEGFTIAEPSKDLVVSDWNAYFGGVHAIAFEQGEWHGAADPRRDGLAIDATPE